jgi:hypothetical protein
VGVSALRNAAAMLGRIQEPVAVDHRDPGVRLGQHARGEQAGHASSQDYRMITDLAHLDRLQELP